MQVEAFKKPISILRAFSSELTALNQTVSSFEPQGLFSYSLAVEAFSSYKLPDHTSDKRNGGYTDALDNINTYTIHKYDDRYVLNEKACLTHEKEISSLEDFHKIENKFTDGERKHHCILLHKLNIKEMNTELRYEDSKFAKMIKSFLDHLATCKPELDSFFEKFNDNLLVTRARTHVLFDVFNQTKTTVSKIKEQFHRSINEYEKEDK